ncbi:MAG: ABC transporter ATP-binding protein [Alkalilacustris sp.]
MRTLTLDRLSKQYDATTVVDRVSVEVAQGELVALLGPSGCGKTTTLRMIAGFVQASGGRIVIGGEDVTRLPPHQRDIGMVFQGYALFPHMTVAQNVGFGLEMRRVPKAEAARRIDQALQLVRLDHLAERYPRQLSGGQQQRVALARALVVEPAVFLLDEPLSNLDAKLRETVRQEIRDLQKSLGLTTVFVTHDQEEALAVADRLIVMNAGRVEQVGPPEALYDAPETAFVADFIGKSNFFEGRVEAAGQFRLDGGGPAIRFAEAGRRGRTLAVRPERIHLAPEGTAGDTGHANRFPGAVEGVTFLGAVIEVRMRLDGGAPLTCRMPNGESAWRPAAGDRVEARWSADAARVLEGRGAAADAAA